MSEIVYCVQPFSTYCQNRKFIAAFYSVSELQVFGTDFAFVRSPKFLASIRNFFFTPVYFLFQIPIQRYTMRNNTTTIADTKC